MLDLRVIPAVLVLGACGTAPVDVDGGAPDAGAPDAFRLDGGPRDSGPPPPMVPAEGWTNAIAASDPALEIVSGGMTYTNVVADPTAVIGPPNGLTGTFAIGDVGHFFVADLGAGEEAFDGEGDDLHVREIDLRGGGVPERYAVSVGDDPAGPFTMLGEATGSHDFDLDGTGVASARYVRIDAVQTADEILDAPGSPEYPGAEIDAVGAYHPGSATAP